MNSSDAKVTQIDRAQKRSLSLGVLGAILLVVFGVIDSHRAGSLGWTHFFQSYLFAYVYVVAVALGCLAILMLHHLTGGTWGLPIRRILEAGSRTLWLMAALVIPILVGMSRLYPWMQPGVIPDDPVDNFKRAYLQHGFFITRTVIYFAIWVIIAHLLNKWSAEQDRTADLRMKDHMGALSGIGLVIWGLSVSAAAVDWVMSLEPYWSSTIYGMVFMVIMALAGLAFSIFVLRTLSGRPPLKDCVPPKDYNDLGNLVLAFTLLWTYMSFSQFLIIWAGNLKDEIPWYLVRAFGSWRGVAVVLLLFHFFLPFFILLQRRFKRKLSRLALVAGWMLVVTLVDVYWLVVPAFENEHKTAAFRLLDVFAVIGLGGIWLAAFYGQLKKLPLLPLHDPRFEGILEHQHGD
ncbi:MAG TPA: hypothetical protein VEJ38_03275 [Candidatus Acidoferrales bacterium]|nr:hypothetical protein [Candidatus Acidoferrales bacterium]